MGQNYVGIPESTLRSWVREISGEVSLELPSEKSLKVREILGSDNNNYMVVEGADSFALALDILINPGKIVDISILDS